LDAFAIQDSGGEQGVRVYDAWGWGFAARIGHRIYRGLTLDLVVQGSFYGQPGPVFGFVGVIAEVGYRFE